MTGPIDPPSAARLQRAIDRLGPRPLARVENGRRVSPSWPIALGEALIGSQGDDLRIALSGPPFVPAIVGEWSEVGDRKVSVCKYPEEQLVLEGLLVPSGGALGPAPGFRVVRAPEVPAEFEALRDMAVGFRLRAIRQHARGSSDFLPLAGGGDVEYLGFEATPGHSRPSLVRLHGIVASCLADAERAWSWSAPLRVSFFSSRKIMGSAYDPGIAAGRRRVGLATTMLARSASDQRRVVLHELCHHYREERLPRTAWGDEYVHDDAFCAALALVDPAAADARHCRNFVPDVTFGSCG